MKTWPSQLYSHNLSFHHSLYLISTCMCSPRHLVFSVFVLLACNTDCSVKLLGCKCHFYNRWLQFCNLFKIHLLSRQTLTSAVSDELQKDDQCLKLINVWLFNFSWVLQWSFQVVVTSAWSLTSLMILFLHSVKQDFCLQR